MVDFAKLTTESRAKNHLEALELAKSYGFSSVLQAVTTAGQYINGTQPDVPPSTPVFTPNELKMLALALTTTGQLSAGGHPGPQAMEILVLQRQQFDALMVKTMRLCGLEVSLPPAPGA